MKPELQRRVQRYGWDKAADYYEDSWAEQLIPAQNLLLKMAGLKEGENVVDIACGTGLVSFQAAKKVGESGFVLGTDISDRMIEASIELSKTNNISNVSFERMDAEDLKIDDHIYNVSLSALGLMYYPDPVKACTEMKRVIKQAGRAVGAVWGDRNNCGWAEIFPIVDSRVETDVCPMFFQLGTKDSLKLTFEMAGLKDVKLERISTTLHYNSSEVACSAVFAGGPVALAYARFDDKTKDEAHAEYIESIKDFWNEDHYEIPGEFVVASGINS
jgi:ubiquinone/menaquinone biosynthesis C-methylase UbiE